MASTNKIPALERGQIEYGLPFKQAVKMVGAGLELNGYKISDEALAGVLYNLFELSGGLHTLAKEAALTPVEVTEWPEGEALNWYDYQLAELQKRQREHILEYQRLLEHCAMQIRTDNANMTRLINKIRQAQERESLAS